MAENYTPGLSPRDISDDTALVERLRQGDDSAFIFLVNRHHNALLREAGLYVNDIAVAEEVVQETWIAVLKGLSRFEGRSSLKTWLFTIVANRAKTRAHREE